MVLTDTGEAMDKKERKEFVIETMKDKFGAVETMQIETCAYAPCYKPSDLPRLDTPVNVTRPSS